MVVVCECCETVLMKGKSKCCKANIWLRKPKSRYKKYVCMNCCRVCEVIEVKEDDV